MKYDQFIKYANIGDFSAFVYDYQNNRYEYASGEVNYNVFDYTSNDTEFFIAAIDDFPEVKQIIIDNFLAELSPAKDVVDDKYQEIERILLAGEAKVGYWDEYTKYGPDTIKTTVYMLIL